MQMGIVHFPEKARKGDGRDRWFPPVSREGRSFRKAWSIPMELRPEAGKRRLGTHLRMISLIIVEHITEGEHPVAFPGEMVHLLLENGRSGIDPGVGVFRYSMINQNREGIRSRLG